MFNFFYDSLDTLKQVKKPTKKDIIVMTVQIFIVVLLATILFALTDTIFLSLFKQITWMFLK